MKKWIKNTAYILAGIGSINWALASINANIVQIIANAINAPVLATIVYWLVGISGVMVLYDYFS